MKFHDGQFTASNGASGKLMFRPRRILALLMVLLTLHGCAADRLHSQGLELMDEGKVVEGVAKLNEAVKKDPDNLSFRNDLIRRRDQAVQRMLMSADNERSVGHLAAAGLIYQRVLVIDSENPRAKAGLENIQRDERHTALLVQIQALFDKHDLDSAQNMLRTVLLENPDQREAKQLQRKIDEQVAKDAMAGPMLKPEFRKPVTLQFRDANLRMVIEALSRSNGINIILDKDVKNDLKTTIFVKDASVEDTIDLVLLQNQLEKKILSDNTILIYPSNPAKIKEYQDLMIRTFHLTNSDAKQMLTMIKTMLKTKDLYVDEKTNSLVMRDTPDAVRLAEKLIAAQDLAEPEVLLEVEVLEITRSRLTELGIKLPQQFTMSAYGTLPTTTQSTTAGGSVVTTSTPAQPLTLESLKNIDGSMVNVSTLTATIDMRSESGDANILASPRIRVRNKEKAKILIGDRVPVITNAVTPVATGAPVVTGTVQYLDVGLKLDVEPDIHLDDDVAIKVSLEVSNIVREVASGPTLAYQIGTRSANTVLRLKDGESQVLAGLISNEDRQTAQKFPGLGDLPILGRLFSSHKDDGRKTEIVLSITPHLTRSNQRPDAKNIEFWSGTDGVLRSRPITLPTGGNVSPESKPTTPESKPSAALPSALAKPAASTTPAPIPAATAIQAAPVATPVLARDAAAIAKDSSGNPIVLSWQGPTQAKVGDEFQVTVEAQSSQALGMLSFTVGYDPKTLRMVRVAEGDLLKQDGKKTVFTSKIDPDTGQTFVHMTRLGPQGVTGKGSVATVTFVARAAMDKSPIVITNPTTKSGNGQELARASSTPLVVTLTP